jgi:hypothetical protein
LTSFRDHHRHKNPHKWLVETALMTFQLHLGTMLELDWRRTSEMAVLNSNQLSSIWCSKAHSASRPRRMPMLISNISWDLQHIHHPRSNSGCGTPLPLSIFIIRKGKTLVLFQQGGSVNLGEMRAFLPKIFLLGKTNALWNKISAFQQLTDETIAEAWERL